MEKKRKNTISLDCCSNKRPLVSSQFKIPDTTCPRSVPYSSDTSIRDEHLSKDDVNYESVLSRLQVIDSTKMFNCVARDPYTYVKSTTSYSSQLHQNLKSTGTSDTKTDTILHLDIKTNAVKTVFVSIDRIPLSMLS